MGKRRARATSVHASEVPRCWPTSSSSETPTGFWWDAVNARCISGVVVGGSLRRRSGWLQCLCCAVPALCCAWEGGRV